MALFGITQLYVRLDCGLCDSREIQVDPQLKLGRDFLRHLGTSRLLFLLDLLLQNTSKSV